METPNNFKLDSLDIDFEPKDKLLLVGDFERWLAPVQRSLAATRVAVEGIAFSTMEVTSILKSDFFTMICIDRENLSAAFQLVEGLVRMEKRSFAVAFPMSLSGIETALREIGAPILVESATQLSSLARLVEKHYAGRVNSGTFTDWLKSQVPHVKRA